MSFLSFSNSNDPRNLHPLTSLSNRKCFREICNKFYYFDVINK